MQQPGKYFPFATIYFLKHNSICQQFLPTNEAFGTIMCISTSSAQQTNFVGTGNMPITYCIPGGSM